MNHALTRQDHALEYLRSEGVDLAYDPRSGEWRFTRTYELLKALQKLSALQLPNLESALDDLWKLHGNGFGTAYENPIATLQAAIDKAKEHS